MPSGLQAFQEALEDLEARKNAGGGKGIYFKLADGEEAIVRFLEQGDQLQFAYVHELPHYPGKNYGPQVPCRDQDPETGRRTGADCPGCDKDYKRKFRGAINMIVRDAPKIVRDDEGKAVKGDDGEWQFDGVEDQLFVWTTGIQAFQTIMEKDVTWKGLKSRDFRIRRQGDGLSTVYTIEPAEPDGGPVPMSDADKELEEEKSDLKHLIDAPEFDKWGKDEKKGGKPEVQPKDTSPFMRRKQAAEEEAAAE